MKKWLGMAVLVVGLLLCGAFASSRHPENNDSRSETTQGTEMGSTEAIESKTTAEIETQSQEETEAEDISDVLTGPLTHYIPGMDQSTKENIPQVISSMEEFRAYCEKEETFVSKEEFKAIVDRFDQEFWENYDLLMVNWYEGNTGSRSYIVSLTKGNESSEADWIIAKYIKQEKAGNAVFTPWQSITEIPKGMIKEDETFSFEYYGNPINVAYDIESIRTDMWKPADGGKLWDISETPLYLMDTRDQLEDYCKAHPELQGEFLEICARYDAEFWAERDLLLMVWSEKDGAVVPRVNSVVKFRRWNPDKWFVELVRKIPQTQAEDSAIWHFFIEVKDGVIQAEDVIEILERKVLETN